MIDYVYITPKILTGVFIFLVIQQSGIKDINLQVGAFSLLYTLAVQYGIGYDLNWKELTAATVTSALLFRSKFNLYTKIFIMLASLALLRPFCYIS